MRWLLVGLLAAAGQSFAGDSAQQWLDRMSNALQSLNYDGTFVYLHDDKLEAMRIVHQTGAGGEKERLVSLTGSAREVLRDDKVVTCIMPDNKSVMVGESRPRQPFPVGPRDLESLSQYYHLQDAGDDRIAGEMARVITVTSKDRFRYGYRFWIDTSNYMLLKFDLTDQDGKAIEQVMFTHLSVGAPIPAVAFKPSLTGDGYSWYRQDPDASPAVDPAAPDWVVNRLPAGFKLTHFQHKRMRQDSGQAAHMVFSDGLASLSVYVEKLMAKKAAFSGLSSMGAMNAFGAVIEDHQVTVVGEVPPATVQMVAVSVRRQGSGSD